jgi:predicted signal transduction protein with EAL and GGDEF domain
LQVFARTAAIKLRATDIIGRLGGEEFAAILPGTSLLSAAVAAERVRVAFEEAGKEIDGLPINGTVSIGVASTEDPDCDIDSLFAHADRALYAAKSAGRNRYVLTGSEEELAAPPISGKGETREAPVERRGSISLAPSDLGLAIAAARSAIKSAA